MAVIQRSPRAQVVPQVPEVLCTSGGGSSCRTAFPWASSLYGLGVLGICLLFGLIVRSPAEVRGRKWVNAAGSKRR
jgi:hypothetical protein